MGLEINHGWKNGKSTNTWKPNTTPLNKQQVTEEVSREAVPQVEVNGMT